jgi:hypothetical protein
MALAKQLEIKPTRDQDEGDAEAQASGKGVRGPKKEGEAAGTADPNVRAAGRVRNGPAADQALIKKLRELVAKVRAPVAAPTRPSEDDEEDEPRAASRSTSTRGQDQVRAKLENILSGEKKPSRAAAAPQAIAKSGDDWDKLLGDLSQQLEAGI